MNKCSATPANNHTYCTCVRILVLGLWQTWIFVEWLHDLKPTVWKCRRHLPWQLPVFTRSSPAMLYLDLILVYPYLSNIWSFWSPLFVMFHVRSPLWFCCNSLQRTSGSDTPKLAAKDAAYACLVLGVFIAAYSVCSPWIPSTQAAVFHLSNRSAKQHCRKNIEEKQTSLHIIISSLYVIYYICTYPPSLNKCPSQGSESDNPNHWKCQCFFHLLILVCSNHWFFEYMQVLWTWSLKCLKPSILKTTLS